MSRHRRRYPVTAAMYLALLEILSILLLRHEGENLGLMTTAFVVHPIRAKRPTSLSKTPAINSLMVVHANQHRQVTDDSNTENYNKLSSEFSNKLLQGLDVAALLEQVARFAGTKRARRCVASLVKIDSDESAKTSKAFDRVGSRRDRLRRSLLSTPATTAVPVVLDPSVNAFPVAANLTLAREEYELVQQAMLVLSEDGLLYNLTAPPLYGKSDSDDGGDVSMGPLEMADVHDVDDYDEWLALMDPEM